MYARMKRSAERFLARDVSSFFASTSRTAARTASSARPKSKSQLADPHAQGEGVLFGDRERPGVHHGLGLVGEQGLAGVRRRRSASRRCRRESGRT